MERRRTNGRFEVVDTKPEIEADVKSAEHPFYERGFWVLAAGVILIAVAFRLFDFTLWPVSYKGLYITQPFDGLHSWHFTNQYWAARSHIKYGIN
jgi:hypothetical protein